MPLSKNRMKAKRATCVQPKVKKLGEGIDGWGLVLPDVVQPKRLYHTVEEVRRMREFEKQHPEISMDDIVNPDVMLPEDSQFVQILNPVKKKLQLERDLVTIEQTSGCLSTDAYKYLIPFAFSIR